MEPNGNKRKISDISVDPKEVKGSIRYWNRIRKELGMKPLKPPFPDDNYEGRRKTDGKSKVQRYGSTKQVQVLTMYSSSIFSCKRFLCHLVLFFGFIVHVCYEYIYIFNIKKHPYRSIYKRLVVSRNLGCTVLHNWSFTERGINRCLMHFALSRHFDHHRLGIRSAL